MSRYTKEEDAIIIEEVKKSPNNLQKAFKAASEKINRSQHCIRARWYRVLRKEQTCFVLVGRNSYKNTKGNSTNYKVKTTKTLFSKIIKWLKLK